VRMHLHRVRKNRKLPKILETWRLEVPPTARFIKRRRLLRKELKHRIYNPGFDHLAALYGAKLPHAGVARRMKALQKLAAANWDFRKGKMRYDVDFDSLQPGESAIDLTDARIQKAIETAAVGFGLALPSHPSRDTYDGLIVPGGASWSPYLRLKYALEQRGPSGQPIRFDWIAMLGCDRIVSKAEHETIKEYAPKAKTEFDLMVAVAEDLLDVTLVRDAKMRRVGYAYDRETEPHVRYYKAADDTLVLIFNAPIPAGETKANTGHTYDFLRAASGPRLGRGRHVLISSTAHVRAFQHVDAERLLSLPTGISIETIGYSKKHDGGEGYDTQLHALPPKELLQEIKSYVDTLAKLQRATIFGSKKALAQTKE